MQSCLILNATTLRASLESSTRNPRGWCTTSTPRPSCCFTPGPWGFARREGLGGVCCALVRRCSLPSLSWCLCSGRPLVNSSTQSLILSFIRSLVHSLIQFFFPLVPCPVSRPSLLLRHRQSFQSTSSLSHHITAAVRECVCALSSPVLWPLSIIFRRGREPRLSGSGCEYLPCSCSCHAMPCYAMLCHPPFRPSPSCLRERLANHLLLVLLYFFFISRLVLASPSLSRCLFLVSPVSLSSSPLCRTLPFSLSHLLALSPSSQLTTHQLTCSAKSPPIRAFPPSAKCSPRPGPETSMQRPACPGQSTPAPASLRHPGSACQRQHWLHGGGHTGRRRWGGRTRDGGYGAKGRTGRGNRKKGEGEVGCARVGTRARTRREPSSPSCPPALLSSSSSKRGL